MISFTLSVFPTEMRERLGFHRSLQVGPHDHHRLSQAKARGGRRGSTAGKRRDPSAPFYTATFPKKRRVSRVTLQGRAREVVHASLPNCELYHNLGLEGDPHFTRFHYSVTYPSLSTVVSKVPPMSKQRECR